MKFSDWLKKISIILLAFFVIDFVISEVLLAGLNKYFGLHSKSDILINGSSMAMAGFDKTNLERSLNKKIAFYTRTGVSLQDRNAMLHHYFDASKDQTEIAIFEVNPLLFSKKFTAANVYMLFLPFIDEPSMNIFVKNRTDAKDYWVRKIIRCSRYNTDLIALAIKGFTGNYENQKHLILDLNALSGLKNEYNAVPVELDPEKIRLFEESVTLMKKHSRKVILVNMPVFTTKLQTFKADEYQKYMEIVEQVSKSESNTFFLDLSKPDIDDNANYFSDPLHLNANGQIQVTAKITKFIKGI